MSHKPSTILISPPELTNIADRKCRRQLSYQLRDTTGKYDGPQLLGRSDAATHGWQNFWGPCLNAQGAAGPKGQKAAKR